MQTHTILHMDDIRCVDSYSDRRLPLRSRYKESRGEGPQMIGAFGAILFLLVIAAATTFVIALRSFGVVLAAVALAFLMGMMISL